MGGGTAATAVVALRRVLLVGGVCAAAAIVLVLLLARGGSTPSVDPTAPVLARAGVTGRVVQFGDPVLTRVVVALDRSAVRPGTLHVAVDLAPLTPLAGPVTTRTVSGRLETVTLTQRAACLTQPCLTRTVTLRPVHVTVTGRDGTTNAVSARWRPLLLRSRITAAELERATPRFAADTSPGTPTYAVDPGAATTVLELIAALAAAAAVALLTLEIVVRRRRRVADVDDLERALRLVREAEGRPAPDRRRALALLARLLRQRDGSLARRADDLAWSAPPPEPDDAAAIATQVERERAG